MVMTISKEERKRLIGRISWASGIAQYALQKKMTDEQVIEAFENLKVLELIKESNNYNRSCQKLKTEEANNKLKRFLALEHSEVFQAGKWLINAISMTGQDRKKALLEKELVHKENYNEAVSDLKDTITTVVEIGDRSTEASQETIKSLEKRIDDLRKQLSSIEKYISNNYGKDKWKIIKKTFDLKEDTNESS
jgi:bacterioferritin (cytochrome b1)